MLRHSRFLALLFAFFVTFASANIPLSGQYQVQNEASVTGPISSSPEAACQGWVVLAHGHVDFGYSYVYTLQGYNASTQRCNVTKISTFDTGQSAGVEPGTVGVVNIPASCVANSIPDPNGNGCVCMPGFIEQGGACVKNNCAVGTVQTVNLSVGWSRTSNTNADVVDGVIGPVKMPGVSYTDACVSGCKVTMDANSVTSMFVAKTPSAEGLYRISADTSVVKSGETCQNATGDAGADDPVRADSPPRKCPGYVGQVNGVTTCVGTASAPLPSPTGDTGKLAGEAAAKGDAGNPVAGLKPDTGEGSGSGGVGRTPSVGYGQASGGPASAAIGGKGSAPNSSSGTVTKPSDGTEQQNCGAPGQPQCKLDETGTPGAVDASKYSGALDSAKTDADNARSTISGSGDKGMFESMRTLLTSAPPVASCQAFDLPRDMGSINPCPVVDGVRLVMAYMWAIGGFWLCVRMVKKVV